MKDVKEIIRCISDNIPSIEVATDSVYEEAFVDNQSIHLYFWFNKPFTDYADYRGNMPFVRLAVCKQLASLIPEHINADNALIDAINLDGFGIMIQMPAGWQKQIL